MQQHRTSTPNRSCILHVIEQYQLHHCVRTVLLSVSLLMFHTEPKSLPLLNGAFYNLIYVYFMWC